MIHTSSSSHPKRQANYNARQRPRKPLKGEPIRMGPSGSHGLYDLTRRHRLIIRESSTLALIVRSICLPFSKILDSLSRNGSYRLLVSLLIQAPMHRDRWTLAGPLLHQASSLIRIPEALRLHKSSTRTTSYGPNLVFVNHNRRRKINYRSILLARIY